MRTKTGSLLTLIAAFSLLVVACSGTTEEDGPAEQPGLVFEAATVDPRDVTLEDISDAARREGLDNRNFNTVERSDEGITLNVISPEKLQVGREGTVFVDVINVSKDYRPESPFSFSQTSAQIIPGGPITIGRPDGVGNSNSFTVAPGLIKGVFITVNCESEGPASVTFQSIGLSEIETPAVSYSITAAANFECVEVDENAPDFSELTDRALGFSEDSLTWVTFDQDGIVLKVNQIEPIELPVGDSIEIYSYFDARVATDFPFFDPSPDRLIDGEIDFTSGGPVTLDSPPQRVAEPATYDGGAGISVFWGFRAGTLTCDSEGEGVYHANLRGKRFDGDAVLQTVSGSVDCVEPSDNTSPIADELDFSGAWSRKARPDGAYVPTGRDDFPGNTELYFDRQLCVARVQGIRACDVAYWVYGADWFELAKQGNAERSVDQAGNEVFVTEYSGVFHHKHSYLLKTEIPDDLLRKGKSWGTAWDLGAGLTDFTFEVSGTVTYSPNAANPLTVSIQGAHPGELAYTHTSKIGISYSGPVPDGDSVPFGVGFSEDLRRPDHAPEGMFQGSDRAFTGAFYSASIQTDGVIAGTVRPASTAEKVDHATVEIFRPGEESPFASKRIDSSGKFAFSGLQGLKPVDTSDGGPEFYGSQYKIVVSDAESEVDGNTLLFQEKTQLVRPFTDTTIFIEPTPATHFIAIGDRGVGGAPIVFHYSLEYWTCGGRFEPLHHIDGFTPEELFAKCRELDPRAFPKKLGAVELLARTDWEVWAGVDDLVGTERSWLKQGVWIAEIVYEGISATELMPIFAGNQDEIEAKWAEIIDLAENYPWAEQAGFAQSTFTQWPMSMYDPLGTNSNTFIRYLITNSGLLLIEMDGPHPGDLTPEQNAEYDLARRLSFYPEHTPWTGENEKPEPSEQPVE